jgi:hypothetical protein
MRSDDILSEGGLSDFNLDPKRPARCVRPRDADVATFLRTALVEGAVAVTKIEMQAHEAGLLANHQRITNAKPFKRAKAVLGIKSVREGFGRGGEWVWTLPPPANVSAPGAADHLLPERRLPAIQTEPLAVTYDDIISGAEPNSLKESLINDAEIGLPPEFRDVVGVPPSWLAGVARLDRQGTPRDVLPHRWRQFVVDCTRFVLSPDGWARRAADLGWDAPALFGCSRRSPLVHLGCAGLLWVVGGGRIVRLHVDWAEIQPPANGSRRTYHRRRVSPDLITLPWLMR